MRPGENHHSSDGDERHSSSGRVAFDQEETLIQQPEDFDDNFEEFNDNSEAEPGDRRRDPLRKNW
jgi:hypothetical protein